MDAGPWPCVDHRRSAVYGTGSFPSGTNPLEAWFGHFESRTRLTLRLKTGVGTHDLLNPMAAAMA